MLFPWRDDPVNGRDRPRADIETGQLILSVIQKCAKISMSE